MIFFGEPPLQTATREFAADYHTERSHQGLDDRLIEPDDRLRASLGAIECTPRLGGILRFYHCAAA